MKNRLRLRWLTASLAAAGLAAAGAFTPARAQLRRFPPQTRVGEFELLSFPRARLNGKDVMLAPGVRILSTDNLLVVPSSLSGARTVRYRLDPGGQPIEIWLLTPQEAEAARREPSSS